MANNFEDMESRAIEIASQYRSQGRAEGKPDWKASDYVAGLGGDFGKLSKLVMAKSGLREIEGDLDKQIQHELHDILWSTIVIAHELGYDNLGEGFIDTMNELEQRIVNEKS